jgi:dTDP-glucose 4,6-dehydratase
METILIIGSNSFSGATFADFALAQGGKVMGTSRSVEPNDAFLPYKWHDHKNFTFHELDLNRHLKELSELVQDTKPAFVGKMFNMIEIKF